MRVGMPLGMSLLGVFLVFSIPAGAAGLPSDASVNPSAPNKTLEPKVVVNSGRLEWVPFARDLTPWPTLSHEDKRSTPAPKRAKLDGALKGDAARGRELAMRRDKGYCIVCHQLPGEDWPGTVGVSLDKYPRFKHPDELVFQQLYDARVFNPNTVMPPYGTFGILTDQELRDLVAYLQSLE